MLTVILSLLLTGLGFAQSSSLPGTGWWTGVTLQNVGGAEATVSIQPMGPAGSTNPAPTTLTIPAGGQATRLVTQLGVDAGFEGSAVVNSDQPLNAVTNVTNREIESLGVGIEGGRAAAQYQGVAGAVSNGTLTYPLVKNDYFDKTTIFYVQNAGDADATVNFAFTTLDGRSFTRPALTIQPGRMAAVHPNDASYPAGDDANNIGSLTVTSAQPLAGVVLEYNNAETGANTILQATRGLTPQDEDDQVFAPTVKNDFVDRFTGIQVQNVSDGAIDVTVSYRGIAQSPSTCGEGTANPTITDDTRTAVAPGASVNFTQLAGVPAGVGSNVPVGCLAAATVNATGAVVVTVNESYVPGRFGAGTEYPAQGSTTYFGIPANQASNRLSAPVHKENHALKTTGLSISNAGAAAANVTLRFTCGDAQTQYVTKPQSLGVGQGRAFLEMRLKADIWQEGTTPMPSDVGTANNSGLCSVIAESDQPIVALANETSYPIRDFESDPGRGLQQDKNNYEGFPLQAE